MTDRMWAAVLAVAGGVFAAMVAWSLFVLAGWTPLGALLWAALVGAIGWAVLSAAANPRGVEDVEPSDDGWLRDLGGVAHHERADTRQTGRLL
jgi:hypothetical protein